jgi:hypothetical protein
MITIIKKGTSASEMQKQMQEALKKAKNSNRKKDISPFFGKINLKIDAIEYQKKMRDEWE